MTDESEPGWAQEMAAEAMPQALRFKQNLARVSNLLRIGVGLRASPKVGTLPIIEDLLRAATVLLHAALEDFLRSVALLHLPHAPSATLDTIPLVGSVQPRPEKFLLGRLAEHRGKTVNDVIRTSVALHLERSTYNSVRDVAELLKGLNFELRGWDDQPHKDIEALMRRRHQIVHRADRRTVGIEITDQPEAITTDQVAQWLGAVESFGGWVWAVATLQMRLRQLNIDPHAPESA